MQPTLPSQIAVLAEFGAAGYLLAAALYFVLAILFLTAWRAQKKDWALPLAVAGNGVWALVLGIHALTNHLPNSLIAVSEASRDALWVIFLCMLLRRSATESRARFLNLLSAGCTIGVASLAVALSLTGGASNIVVANLSLVYGSLMLTLLGIVLLEQNLRNVRVNQRRGMRYLALGLGGLFVYDLFLYSHALLLQGISNGVWSGRGFVNAALIPFLVIASRALPQESRVFISRQFVFYSGTIVAAGVYLLSMAAGGYYIRVVGSQWGPTLQVVFLFGAAVFLFGALFSDTLRDKFKVFVVKHFYENKYDYREEWLRLTRTLTSGESQLTLRKRCVQAIAQIIDSESGRLWLFGEPGQVVTCSASWNCDESEYEIASDDDVLGFIDQTGWVVNLQEHRSRANAYPGLIVSATVWQDLDQPILVPLEHAGQTLGIISLETPPSEFRNNFEDHDLLKVAASQAASYLALERSSHLLAENRQFEALNRLTAFIMHDIKNLLAQLTLVVENADRHRHNPAFIDDAIDTIKNSTKRMSNLIATLNRRSPGATKQNTDIVGLCNRTVDSVSDRRPVPTLDCPSSLPGIDVDPQRLEGVLTNLLRNAQDATDADGSIELSIDVEHQYICISVQDSGSGMDQRFIQERLFKPFDSTKGTHGMGIGAYEVREFAREQGGTLEVHSKPDAGTRFDLRIPLRGPKR